MLPPSRWIFYFLSSCYISHIKVTRRCYQYISHLNYYCVHESKQEGLILMQNPLWKVLAGTKFWTCVLRTQTIKYRFLWKQHISSLLWALRSKIRGEKHFWSAKIRTRDCRVKTTNSTSVVQTDQLGSNGSQKLVWSWPKKVKLEKITGCGKRAKKSLPQIFVSYFVT